MTLTWHIFRKDLRRLRLPLALWTALMAVKILFYARISGVIGSPDLVWLGRMQLPPFLLLRSSLEPLIAFILVAALVYEDPLVGQDPFWVTRPISGFRLLGAKALGAALLFVAWPVLINVPWWLSCGFGWDEIQTAAVPMVAEYGAVVILGMGVAAATNGFPRYFLWTIAGIAGVGVLHLIVAEIIGKHVSFTPSGDMTGTVLTAFVIVGLCVLLLCLEIIAYKYGARHFRRSLIVLGAATILCSGVLCCSSFNLFSILGSWWGYRPQQTSAAAQTGPGEVRIELSKEAGDMPQYGGSMSMWVKILGMDADTAAFTQTYAEWKSNGASVWKAAAWDGGPPNAMIQDRMRHMLGQNQGSNDFTGYHVFPFPRALALRHAKETFSMHLTMNLYLVKGRIAAEAPVNNQKIRHLGGSITIENIDRSKDRLSMFVTDRFVGLNLLERYGIVWPRAAVWALVDRKTGHMEVGREGNLGSWGLQLNMVQVLSQRIEYNLRPHSHWSDDAHLVVFDFVAERTLARALDADPFRFSVESPKASP